MKQNLFHIARLTRTPFLFVMIIALLSFKSHASDETAYLLGKPLQSPLSGVPISVLPAGDNFYRDAIAKGLAQGLMQTEDGILRGQPAIWRNAATHMVPPLREAVEAGHKGAQDLIIQLLPHLAGFQNPKDLDEESREPSFKKRFNHHKDNMNELIRIIEASLLDERFNKARQGALKISLSSAQGIKAYLDAYQSPEQKKRTLKIKRATQCGLSVLAVVIITIVTLVSTKVI